MTNEQKKIIKRMREKLCSYAEIADALGISFNSVKSFCLRNGLTTEALTKDATKCKACGKPIISKSKTKPRIFCNDACKLIWWKEHKTEHSSSYIVEHSCPTCGKKFTAYKSSKRKYCSELCYQRRNYNG